jgi:type VI secretion system protein ImpM
MSGKQLGSQVGLYGKLPIFGDFVIRNLNGEFIEPWDAWLQECLAYSRQVMDGAWLDSYLAAPIWRFVIGPTILGNNAWIGIVMPSVDRVGRYFPLTLAQPIDPDIDLTTTYLANCDWFRALEQLGTDALARDLNFNDFESRMTGFMPPVPVVDMNAGDATIPMLKTAFISSYFTLPGESGDGSSIAQIREVLAGTHQPVSLWGTECDQTREHYLLASEALPIAERYTAFLDKKFETHRWVDASRRYAAVCVKNNSDESDA